MASVAASFDDAGIADIKTFATWLLSLQGRDDWAPFMNDKDFRDDHIQQLAHRERGCRMQMIHITLGFMIDDLRDRAGFIFKVSGPCDTIIRPYRGNTFPAYFITVTGRDTATLDQITVKEATLLRFEKETRVKIRDEGTIHIVALYLKIRPLI
ncbi:hypothetical protein CDD81_464 [Ophiocordyceps australis]|uniref:Uncharacterized protein n=1 Tax=Ophiocordyceps australis TaxID=1399860 RepID=A0A2C5Y1N8_9HYPO|nr:hypothetical protein CDD81_464 [Ophiocordyceps australis]